MHAMQRLIVRCLCAPTVVDGVGEESEGGVGDEADDGSYFSDGVYCKGGDDVWVPEVSGECVGFL